MPDEQAGRAAFAVGRQFARIGQWDLARETFLLMVDRYPAHPLTPDALRWLIHHNCSSEARRRSELGQFVAAGQVQFGSAEGPPRPPMPPAGRTDDDKDRRSYVPSCRSSRPTQSIAARQHRRQPRRVRKWYQGGLDLEPRLAAFGPLFADDPAVQFCLQAARRNLGEFDAADEVVRRLRRPPAGRPLAQRRGRGAVAARPRRAAAQGRRLLPLHRGTAVPRRQARRRLLAGAPRRCRCATPPATRAGDYKTEARMAYDHEFLYLAVRCTHPADRREPPAKPRTHDADLRGHDRVSLLLDLDRDYATCFHFEVDQRGCIADDCWGDKTWDPRWFVAVHKDDTEWMVEAAIPLAALTGDGVTPGRAWAAT